MLQLLFDAAGGEFCFAASSSMLYVVIGDDVCYDVPLDMERCICHFKKW